MEAGHFGHHGRHAVLVVVLVRITVPDHVIVQPQQMGDLIALDQIVNQSLA